MTLLAGLLAACGTTDAGAPTAVSATRTSATRTPASPAATTGPTGSPGATPPPPASVHANELGRVPVLMYHQLRAAPKGVYDITPAAFLAELERLAREGYVPVTAAEYAAGRLDAVPAGRHPVVLTFDDSTTSQLALGADGRPVPGCAVAILQDVARRHPGFRPVATMYVNRHPYASAHGERVLQWLQDNGFEIGNHTLDHVDLKARTAAQVQAQIAGDQAMIASAAPRARVTTLALPMGIRPVQHLLAARGASGGTTYAYAAVFLVGAEPAPSPYTRALDRLAVPRIRSAGAATTFGSTYWLDWLDRHPDRRYTSDGDPARVSFPRALAPYAGPHLGSRAAPY